MCFSATIRQPEPSLPCFDCKVSHFGCQREAGVRRKDCDLQSRKPFGARFVGHHMSAMSVLVRSRVARFTFACGSLSNLPFWPRTRACATPDRDVTFSSANRATSIGCRYAKVWFNYSTMSSLNACFANFSEDAIDYKAAGGNSRWRRSAVDKPRRRTSMCQALSILVPFQRKHQPQSLSSETQN